MGTLLRTSIVYYFSTQVAESSTKKYKESKRERRRERDSEREKIDQRPPAFAGTSVASDGRGRALIIHIKKKHYVIIIVSPATFNTLRTETNLISKHERDYLFSKHPKRFENRTFRTPVLKKIFSENWENLQNECMYHFL